MFGISWPQGFLSIQLPFPTFCGLPVHSTYRSGLWRSLLSTFFPLTSAHPTPEKVTVFILDAVYDMFISLVFAGRGIRFKSHL